MVDHSKIGRSNVRKGKTLERRVANLFQSYTNEQFRRRRVEGRDLSVIERESTADVIPVSKTSKYIIEVKSGAGFSFDALLSNPEKCQFTKWWHQASYDAELVSKLTSVQVYPLLWFKESTHDWISIPQESLQYLEIVGDLPCIKYHYTVNPISMNVVNTANKDNYKMVPITLHDICVLRWQDFTKHIKPQSIFKD